MAWQQLPLLPLTAQGSYQALQIPPTGGTLYLCIPAINLRDTYEIGVFAGSRLNPQLIEIKELEFAEFDRYIRFDIPPDIDDLLIGAKMISANKGSSFISLKYNFADPWSKAMAFFNVLLDQRLENLQPKIKSFDYLQDEGLDDGELAYLKPLSSIAVWDASRNSWITPLEYMHGEFLSKVVDDAEFLLDENLTPVLTMQSPVRHLAAEITYIQGISFKKHEYGNIEPVRVTLKSTVGTTPGLPVDAFTFTSMHEVEFDNLVAYQGITFCAMSEVPVLVDVSIAYSRAYEA